MSPPSSLAARGRQWLAVAAKAAITVALLGWLLTRIEIGPVLDRFAAMSLPLAAAAIVVLAVQLALTGGRWALICRAIGAPLPRGPILRLTFIGQFFSQTLPSAVGGDAVRMWLASREGVPLGKAITGVLADRLVALLVLIAVAAAALPMFLSRVADPAARLFQVAVIVAAAIGLAAFLLVGPTVAGWLQRFKPTRPFAALAVDFRRVIVDPKATPILFALGVAVHLMVIASTWLLALALSLPAGFVDCLVLVPPIVLITMLPISIAGWGVREGAMVVGFGFVGVPAPDALALSVAFGLGQIAVGIPGGLIWLGSRGASGALPAADRGAV